MLNISNEVIVVGNGIASLICANILAQKGRKVKLCVESSELGGFCGEYRKAGFNFSINPFYLAGMESRGNIRRLLDSFNIRPQLKPIDTIYQVILPNTRIDVFGEWERTFLELKRAFPDDIEDILRFYKHLLKIEKTFYPIFNKELVIPPSSFSEKYAFRKEIYPQFNEIRPVAKERTGVYFPPSLKGSLFEKFFNIQCLFFGQTTLTEASFLFSSHIAGLMNHGCYQVENGFPHVIERLKKSFSRYGGTLESGVKVSEIIVEKGKAIGVCFSDGRKERAKDIVVDVSDDTLYGKWIKDEKYYKKIESTAAKNNRDLPRLSPFAVFLGIKEEVIPEKMASNVFFVGDLDKPIMGENAMYISTSPGVSPDGCKAISIFCLTDRNIWKNGKHIDRNKENLKKEIMKNLKKLIIFQEEGIEFIDAWSPLEFEKRVMRSLGEVGEVPCSPENFFMESKGNVTSIKNLYQIGERVYPGIGTEAATISGRNAASIILKGKT